MRFHSLADTNKAIKAFLIVDARSYTAAFANRAKGGGFEYQGNDKNWKLFPAIVTENIDFHRILKMLQQE